MHKSSPISNCCGLANYFMEFLENKKTQKDTCMLIKVLICSQGGLGIFETCIDHLVKFESMKKVLIDLGF